MKILNNYAFVYERLNVFILLFFIYIFFKIKFYKTMGFFISCLLFLLFFFRVPEINQIQTEKYVHAPCYGRIKEIVKTDKYLQIAIFINVTDPHIQYIPYKGYLKDILYKKGEFNPAYIMKKGKYNEKMLYYINTRRGNIIVSQIAGVLARTIVPFVKKNQVVEQNEELGLIKLGSRCDIFIPIYNNMKILVKKGDYVEGTFTKIIEFID